MIDEKTLEDFNGLLKELLPILTEHALSLIGAIAILVIGMVAAGWTNRAVYKLLSKTPKVDETLRVFFASLAKYTVIILVALAVLAQFGIQTASLITILGAAGLAIGLALQGTLSNVAAGVMLLIFRPFKVGDYIEAAGLGGTVNALTLFVTEMSTPDNVHIVVPNSQIWGSSIRNYSHNPTRRLDLPVGIAYEDSIDKAMESLKAVVEAEGRVLKDPEPLIAVTELADSSVNLVVRVWCDRGDYWPLRFDMTKAIKERLDADGITIPYPQRTVHTAAD